MVSKGGGPNPTNLDTRSWGSIKGDCYISMDALNRPIIPGS